MPNERKKSTGRKCSICTHESVNEINGLIRGQVSFRNISKQFDFHYSAVSRHTSEHLRIDLQAIQMEKRIESAVIIEEENREQLNRAKEVRDAAMDYALSRPEGEIVPAFRAAMDGVKTVNVTLDTQAKLKGAYQQDKKNETDIDAAINRAIERMKEKGYDAEVIRDAIKETFGETQLLDTIG